MKIKLYKKYLTFWCWQQFCMSMKLSSDPRGTEQEPFSTIIFRFLRRVWRIWISKKGLMEWEYVEFRQFHRQRNIYEMHTHIFLNTVAELRDRCYCKAAQNARAFIKAHEKYTRKYNTSEAKLLRVIKTGDIK